MLSEFDILMAEYAASLMDENVSSELRTRIYEATERKYNRVMRTADVIILFCNGRVKDGFWTNEKALDSIREEYVAVGLSSIVQYKYFSQAVDIYVRNDEFSALSDQDKVKRIRSIYESNVSNSHETLKRAMNIYCLGLLLRQRVYTLDMSMLQNLVDIVNAYSREEKDNAVLPASIMANV